MGPTLELFDVRMYYVFNRQMFSIASTLLVIRCRCSLLCFSCSCCDLVLCNNSRIGFIYSTFRFRARRTLIIIQVPHEPPRDTSAAFRRSASSTASNFSCSARRSATGSWEISTRSFPASSDFGLLAFCRSSSHEDLVAKFRACSARISSQRLLG